MKIAIDCRAILNPGFGEGAGVGHYTYYLVTHLLRLSRQTEFVLFFDKRLGQEAIRSIVGDHPECRVRYFPFHEYRQYLPGVYAHLLSSAVIAREAPDILHVPGGGIPMAYRGKTILTVHDLAIYRHPEWFPSQPLAVKALYPQSLRKAAHFIVPSQQTSEDLQELFKISSKKISVIYEGVAPHGKLYDEDILSTADVIDAADLQKKYQIKSPYILFLGTIEPRKNLEFLLKVFDKLLSHLYSPSHLSAQGGCALGAVGEGGGEGVQLVLAGASGWKYEKVFEAIEHLNRKYQTRGKMVSYLGYVPHEDKWALMENALCFVYPSLYEGFGLPVLEAMSVGCPVVASNVSSLPEVVGNGGVLIAPDDLNGWVDAIERIKREPRWSSELSKVGLEQARKFSWSRCVEETLEAYQQPVVLKSGGA